MRIQGIRNYDSFLGKPIIRFKTLAVERSTCWNTGYATGSSVWSSKRWTVQSEAARHPTSGVDRMKHRSIDGLAERTAYHLHKWPRRIGNPCWPEALKSISSFPFRPCRTGLRSSGGSPSLNDQRGDAQLACLGAVPIEDVNVISIRSRRG
jgi:hypothetical protein